MPQAERQLVAILAADIAGYSRLMGADEEGTLAQLKACRRELIEPGIARHQGRCTAAQVVGARGVPAGQAAPHAPNCSRRRAGGLADHRWWVVVAVALADGAGDAGAGQGVDGGAVVGIAAPVDRRIALRQS